MSTIYDVVCPTCNAGVGFWCTHAKLSPAVHVARYEALQEANKVEQEEAGIRALRKRLQVLQEQS